MPCYPHHDRRPRGCTARWVHTTGVLHEGESAEPVPRGARSTLLWGHWRRDGEAQGLRLSAQAHGAHVGQPAPGAGAARHGPEGTHPPPTRRCGRRGEEHRTLCAHAGPRLAARAPSRQARGGIPGWGSCPRCGVIVSASYAMVRTYGDDRALPFGHVRVYLLCHPEHVTYVLQGHAPITARVGSAHRYAFARTGPGDQRRALWRTQRRLVQPAFHRERLAGLAATITTATQAILAWWAPMSPPGRHSTC